MRMNEWNADGERTALLVHPALADGNLVKELIADHMGDGWRLLIPDLSGHGSSGEWDFTEIAKEADDIHSWLGHEGVRHLDFLWGASLGAAVAFSLIRYVDASFGSMVLDGVPYMDAGRLGMGRALRKLRSEKRKALKDPEGTVIRMTELYGRAGRAVAEGLISMDGESLSAIMRSCGTAVYPVLKEEEQRNTLFLYGEDDTYLKRAEKRIAEEYPEAEIRILKGQGHCSMMGRDTGAYAEILRNFLSR